MKRYAHNLAQLETVASALAPVLQKLTFVGGCTTILLVDEAAYSGVRQTEDVDVIVDVATTHDYQKFGKELRQIGFCEDQDGPICRWQLDSGSMTVKLDVMPTNEKILGFSNRWYKEAIDNANVTSLPSGTDIRVVSPVYFVATKFEAFKGRGKGNYFSHDLEDIVFVMENRKNLIRELIDSPSEVKIYLAVQAAQLLNDSFLNVLPGLLINSKSVSTIQNNLKIMTSWNTPA